MIINEQTGRRRDTARGGLVMCLMAGMFVCGLPGLLQAATVNVAIRDDSFDPSTVTINAGDTVVWTHMGAMTHTTTSGTACTADGLWDSGNMSAGNTFTRVFSAAGTFNYFCRYHCSMGMTGVVQVNQPQPPVSINVSVTGDATVPRGGLLHLAITVTNNGASAVKLKGWTDVTLPNNTTMHVIGCQSLTLAAKTSRTFNVMHRVPNTAPLGNYTYIVGLGTVCDNPDLAEGFHKFSITK